MSCIPPAGPIPRTVDRPTYRLAGFGPLILGLPWLVSSVACGVEGEAGHMVLSDAADLDPTSQSPDPIEEDDAAAASRPPARPDQGVSPSSGPAMGEASGCTKVDFLFVIDNSISMKAEQDALIASFPRFMETIESLSGVSDYHVLVVDTDAEGKCNPDRCDDDRDVCFDRGEEGRTEGGDKTVCQAENFDVCDTTLGAGVVFPAGESASNQRCNLYGTQRYLTSGEPDLAGAFSCIAQVGLAGAADERPMDALLAALDGEILAADGCNAGFLRDDAILVVTFVSDDGNHADEGTPADWHRAVLAAKGGKSDAVVTLGLVPTPGCEKAGGEHWRQFVGLFGVRGLIGGVCEPAYDPFFAEAVSVIDATCDAFVPII